MLFTFASLVLVNTYSWFGNQGFCTYDFALHESEAALTKVEIQMRPIYDAGDLASGRDALPDALLTLDAIGGERYEWGQTAKVDSDCNVTGFTIIAATAEENGKTVDLLAEKRILIDSYKPVDIKIGAP